MKIDGQNFMLLTFKGETINMRIVEETPNLIELEVMGKPISLQKTNEEAFKKAWLQESVQEEARTAE